MGSGSWGENAAPGHEPGNSPSYPDAYSLYYQGWVMPTVATVANDVAISAHQSLLLGPNPGGTDWLFGGHPGTGEFFLLENRTQQGYDVSTPGCGVVIYRIDETVTPSNGANSDQDDPLIKVMQADGLEDLENGDNRGDAGDPWPGTRRQARLRQHVDAQQQVPRGHAVEPGPARRRQQLCVDHARGRHPPR